MVQPLSEVIYNMSFLAITDKGKRRETNQDRYFVNEELKFFVLADGMGGLSHGELASGIAVSATVKFLEKNLSLGEGDPSGLLTAAINFANKMVIQKASSLGLVGKMGTTLLIGLVKDTLFHCAHVGDSRLYLWRKDLQLLTSDHTVGFNFVKENRISPNKLPSQLKPLTQAIGLEETLTPEYISSNLEPHDILFGCSDGLTDMVGEEEIIQCLMVPDMLTAGNCLIAAANANGGKDNITVILYAGMWRGNAYP
jgi:PPM family protein phosphatase